LFESQYPKFASQPNSRRHLALSGYAAVVYKIATVVDKDLKKDSSKEAQFFTQLNAWERSLGVDRVEKAAVDVKIAGKEAERPDASEADKVDDSPIATALAVFASVAELDVAEHESTLKLLASKASESVWTVQQYKDVFVKSPELELLTVTPFMLQIIVQILPKLESTAGAASGLKGLLIANIGEVFADALWPMLQSFSPKSALPTAEPLAKSEPQAKSESAASEERNTINVLAELGELQRSLESREHKFRNYPAIIKEIAVEASGYIASKAKEDSNEDWITALRDFVSLDDISSVENKTKLALFFEVELLRTLRRRPTRRSKLYETFINYYIERGKCTCFQIQFRPIFNILSSGTIRNHKTRWTSWRNQS
jgi:hypothetical protein